MGALVTIVVFIAAVSLAAFDVVSPGAAVGICVVSIVLLEAVGKAPDRSTITPEQAAGGSRVETIVTSLAWILGGLGGVLLISGFWHPTNALVGLVLVGLCVATVRVHRDGRRQLDGRAAKRRELASLDRERREQRRAGLGAVSPPVDEGAGELAVSAQSSGGEVSAPEW